MLWSGYSFWSSSELKFIHFMFLTVADRYFLWLCLQRFHDRLDGCEIWCSGSGSYKISLSRRSRRGCFLDTVTSRKGNCWFGCLLLRWFRNLFSSLFWNLQSAYVSQWDGELKACGLYCSILEIFQEIIVQNRWRRWTHPCSLMYVWSIVNSIWDTCSSPSVRLGPWNILEICFQF